ncbi:unnamed protein product [Lathyrus oleraceus]
MQIHVIFLPLLLSYLLPLSSSSTIFSILLSLSSCVFSSLFHCLCLPILLSSLPFLQQKQSGCGTNYRNGEDDNDYDVFGDFSMICSIAVVDLWRILVKKET